MRPNQLIIHPVTRRILDKLAQNLPQSLLLSGQKGVGLNVIAWWLGTTNFAIELQPQDAKEQTDSEGGTITVEMIRRLYDQTRAKQMKRQIVIIDDADRMSHAAQSAFLKLLEEPGSNITFILTSHQPDRLLSTIHSRLQQVIIQPVTAEQTLEVITALGVTDKTKLIQLQYIADGLPAELTRLVLDNDSFTVHAGIISDARSLLQGSAYEKVLTVQKYRSSRTGALQLVDSTIKILRRTVSTKPSSLLIGQLDQLLTIREHIANNYSVALQLMQFVL